LKLLSVNQDAKTIKGAKLGFLTGVQYLAPSKESGVADVCPDATNGCKASCLYTSGRAAMHQAVNNARVLRTITFVRDKSNYWPMLVKEIEALIRKAKRENLTPCIRLNGTSDVPWERMRIKGTKYHGLTILEAFKDVQFYDYTKTLERISFTASIDNYHLTASYSETMTDDMLRLQLAMDHNVAVVFRVCEHKAKCGCKLPATWQGHAVIDGDKSDLRFNDPLGVIVGLKAKGDARNDYSGFVVRT